MDFTFANHGNVCILTPHTKAAREWVANVLARDVMRWGQDGIVVEPRYLGPILEGAVNDGFTVKEV